MEPNSGLGEAITYMLKHWKKLTLFLRKAGAPLDNNICERALKKVILHRKNAYFYASLEESVGEFWFGKRAEVVIECGFIGFLGAETVRFSGDQF